MVTTSRNAKKQIVLFAKRLAKEFSPSTYFSRSGKSLDELASKARYEGFKLILIVSEREGKLRANAVRIGEKDWEYAFSAWLNPKKFKEQIVTLRRKIK